MMKKTCVILIILTLVSSCFISVSSFKINEISTKTNNSDSASLPEWFIGNHWKYDMNFVFKQNDDLKVDANINNMYATVGSVDVIDNQVTYTLLLSGIISGSMTLHILNLDIDVGAFRGDLGGKALICKSNLAIKKFEFDVHGTVDIPIIGTQTLDFIMTMDFDPYFDFFNFPISPDEDTWDVKINDATLSASVDVHIPLGQHEFETHGDFNDTMTFKDIKTVNVQAGQYTAYNFNGSLGDPSDLYYAPDAGFLAKLDEVLDWPADDDTHIEAEYHLELLDTNYDISNKPPNTPVKPTGSTECLVGEEYSYTSHTADNENDKVYYWFDWGDGTNSGWLGPYGSSAEATASHRWLQNGMYNVIVKAKDASGIESSWSQPFPIVIKNEKPAVTILMDQITAKDGLDIAPPFGDDLPELYYRVQAVSNIPDSPGVKTSEDFNHNTKNGEYSNDHDDWFSSYSWSPTKEHELLVWTRFVILTVKVMEYDGGGGDDLADVSGCDYPDVNGKDNNIADKRGAVWHGIYDMGSTDPYPLYTYNPNPDDYRDYWVLDDGYYVIRGDDPPDNSVGGEDLFSLEQNDAQAKFAIYDDYGLPTATAKIITQTEDHRPGKTIQFSGAVKNGTAPYTWQWDFNDKGTTSNLQNPSYTYDKTGVYNIKLTVADGYGEKTTSNIQLTIKNENPSLTNSRVEHTGKGETSDTFTFSVFYMDGDGDIPTVKKVFIDTSSYTMQGDGCNMEYTYSITGSQLGSGEHTYYFKFEDSYGGSAQTEKQSFDVKKGKSHAAPLQFTLEKLFNSMPLLTKLINTFFLF